MERNYQFKIGQKVKTKDEDYGTLVKGIVVDKASDCVYIKWEDLQEPVRHFQDEFYKISLITSL